MDDLLRATAPGRVNLIGDHTDYTGGLVLPMVIDRATTISGVWTDDRHWNLTSADELDEATLRLPIADPSTVQPAWARYVAGVLDAFERRGVRVPGFAGRVETTIPIGSGLSSSAALEVAVARILLQCDDPSVRTLDDARTLARLCQEAEHRATGVPCGIMDQLSIITGRLGVATLIDCHDLGVEEVVVPPDFAITERFVHHRTLATSAYAERVAECRAAEEEIGPLRLARLSDVESLSTDVLRRRARHVITENERVRAFAAAMRADDTVAAGRAMTESHWSLARDYETSTPRMDEAVRSALAEPGVVGARMTGGGFGGCIVVLARR
ncbi:MAG: galactokinase [Actinomycetota bacterium]